MANRHGSPASPPPAEPGAAPAENTTPASDASPSGRPSDTVAGTAAPEPGNEPKPNKSGKESAHLSARIVKIDRSPNEMLVHLDNGQVWEELQSTSGDLSLQVGDSVKIDKHLGTWWLTGPHVSGMKVRQKT